MSSLRKELGVLSVYAIATGATLSSGFFLLPGLAFREAGPAVIVSYLLAAAFLVPALLCLVELATAMPRAGGAYYYLDRSLGPLVGTVGGLGIWLALSLKTAFALIGMGAYIHLLAPGAPVLPVAIGLAVLFGAVNLAGARGATSLQVVLVMALLTVLAGFIGGGALRVDPSRFAGFFDHGVQDVFATAGMVYISYVGVTHVASVSEEVKNPERNLPLGLFLSVGTLVLVYTLGTTVIVGLIPGEKLAEDLTPVATAAGSFAGTTGVVVVSLAALIAFSSVANAGILSASRYPLAVSRDHILPDVFARLSGRGIPVTGVAATVGIVVAALVVLEPIHLAKLASSFQLLMFTLLSFAVIVMRESGLGSYDPGYRAPFYPWTPIAGIAGPIFLITEMGRGEMLLVLAFIAAAGAWYAGYARHRVTREGAIYHVFERLGQRRDERLDTELRTILKEKGLREEDPFEEVVTRAAVLDVADTRSFEEIVRDVARRLEPRLGLPATDLAERFLDGARFGATPVAGGAALPHLRLQSLKHPEMAIVRNRRGLRPGEGLAGDPASPKLPVHAFFFLASPEDNPAQHLRLLGELARRIEEPGFLDQWLAADSSAALPQALLRNDRSLSLRVSGDSPLSGRPLRALDFPDDCLVAIIHRGGWSLIPRGNTVVREGDHLTVIGEPEGIETLRRRYQG